MRTDIDIETIPTQNPDVYHNILLDLIKGFKAPSKLSKQEACADLGVDPEGEYKKVSKEAVIAEWEAVMASGKCEIAADEQWRRTALSASAGGEILCIAFGAEEEDIQAVSRRPGESEADMLELFFNTLNAALKGRPPYFCGHNVTFDLKFIYQRAVILGVKPPFEIPHWGRHKTNFFDTMQAWTGSYTDRIKQDDLCKLLGLEGKPDAIDGSKVWDYVAAGEIDKVVDYCVDDVRAVREMYARLTFRSSPVA